jgi:callose synthase
MARVYSNWDRLVRATLRREQLRNTGQGHERVSSGLAGAVPPSLGRATNIDAILQAADEIQSEDPSVARILCEQAYSMAQNLDPNSDGRGVLQFKTGLMSVIKQKLAKRDGASIDRDRDIERLWEFYKLYKRRHRVDDIQKEEQKWRESGTTFSSNVGEILKMRKVFATLRALIEVLEVLSRDADPNGVGRSIRDELGRIKKADATLSAELTPYNIVPLEAQSMTNAIGVFPEVRGAVQAIRYTEHFPRLPVDFEISGQRDADMFDLLEYIFGFQRDNVRNQREHLVLTLSNAQSQLSIPGQNDPKIDENAVNEVFLKVLDNYIKWCKYLRIRVVYNKLEAIDRDRKLFLVSLYFLIWGEAANVRFLPECICYIFHNMAKELDAKLDHGEAVRADSCLTGTDTGSVSFLERIICPIYETISAETVRNNGGKAAHSEWRNYDDFNEYFWFVVCLYYYIC